MSNQTCCSRAYEKRGQLRPASCSRGERTALHIRARRAVALEMVRLKGSTHIEIGGMKMAELIRRNEPLLTRWDPLEVMRDLAGWDPFQQLGTALVPAGFVAARAFSPSFEICETP